jgi:hypothetical protein
LAEKPSIGTIDEHLSHLEKDIRQLKIEYEQSFGGGKPRPPTDIEWRIETVIKRYSDRGAEMRYSQRFRYGNLVQIYTKYREIFRKRMRQREEGIVPRHFGAAARELEKEREQRRSSGSPSETSAQFPFTISCKDPDHERKKIGELFTALRRAKQQAGENDDRLTLEVFQGFVRQKTEQLKTHRGAHEVEFSVTLEGKHARLKARVKS